MTEALEAHPLVTFDRAEVRDLPASGNWIVATGPLTSDALAQSIAERIDPTAEPAKARALMLAELARMLTVQRTETIDDGGVIALIIGLAVVALIAYFLLNMNRQEEVRTDAVSAAAESVGNAAESVGDAARDAVPERK